MTWNWVKLSSVYLPAFKPCLRAIIFIYFLNLAADVWLLKHINIDSLTFQEIHFKYSQIIIEIPLNNLSAIILKNFFSRVLLGLLLYRRLNTSNRIMFQLESWEIVGVMLLRVSRTSEICMDLSRKGLLNLNQFSTSRSFVIAYSIFG